MQTYSFATPRLRYFETALETSRLPLERLHNYETAFMIKIAFVIDTIESPTAGTEKQLLLLLKHLDRTKFKPYLCVLRSSKWLREEFDLCELIDADILSFKKLSAYRNIYKLSRFFRAEGIDIVQTHFVDANKIGIVAAKLAGVNTIISTRRNQGYWHSDRELWILKLLNPFVTAFIANSESTKVWVIQTEGVEESRVNVVCNGIDLELYEKNCGKQMPRHRFNIPDDAPVVGIVANLRPVKGIDVFLRAAVVISQSYPDARFLIVGEGTERVALEKLAVELGLEEQVLFLGRREDVADILKLFNVAVLSSHSESFSNAIIEYLTARLPVVCTDVGGVREAVKDGVNGFVVPIGVHERLGERVVEILDSGAAAEMGRQSRATVEKFFGLQAMRIATERIYIRFASGSL